MSRTALPLPVRDVSAFAKALSRQLSSLGRTPGHLELLNMLARSAGFQNFQHLRESRESTGSLAPALAGALGFDPLGQPDPAGALGHARPDPSSRAGMPGGGQPNPPSQAAAPGDVRVGAPAQVAASGDVRVGAPGQVVASGEVRADPPRQVDASGEAQTGPSLVNARRDVQPALPDQVDERRLKRLLRFFDQTGRMIRWPGKHGQQTDCLWVVWSRLPSGPTGDEAAVNARLAALHSFGDHALLRRELYDRGFLDRTPDGRAYRRLERKPDPLALALIRRVGREEND